MQQQFYNEYISEIPELFLVAEEKERIIGFCMGYYCEKNDYIRSFFKHNILRIGVRIFVLLLTGNRQAWKKVKDVLTKERNQDIEIINETISMKKELAGDLLSICVMPEFRGTGVAQSLIEEYISRLKNKNRNLCLLTVDVNNKRGVRFYERNGFIPYYRNKTKYTYAKRM